MIEKQCQKCKQVKLVELFYKNKTTKDGFGHNCKVCASAYAAVYNRSEKFKQYNKVYRERNKERLSEKQKSYYYDVRKKDTDKLKQSYKIKYQKSKEKYRFYRAKYRADVDNRTPAWADLDRIRIIYSLSKWMDFVNPFVKHHVDHIIPLKGKIVSGLHVHNNLQILTAQENMSKAIRFEPISE